MTTFTIVIPAYNEENGIAEIVGRVLAVEPDLRKVGVDELELLVVDDGSKDKTAAITENLSRSSNVLRLIRHKRNRGYGAALKTGFSAARGDLIGFLDADGTYPPEHFPSLVREAMNGGDLVVGSRMAGAKSEMPLTRRVGNFFFANLLSLLGTQRISDSASGMRVFKRSVLEQIYPLPDGLNLTPVMSARALYEDICMLEVPIPYSERVGRSKLSVVKDGYRFLHSIVWTVMAYNPVRVLGLVGLGGLTITAAVALALVVARLSGVTSLGPWGVVAVFAALISAVAGVSIFALGTTFNYLVSLFYKRPIRQGLFGRPIFKTPIDRHFGWMGGVTVFLGVALAAASTALSLNGWEMSRLWLYLVGSAALILTGVQLVIYWLLMRVLEELSQRELLAYQDRTFASTSAEPVMVHNNQGEEVVWNPK